MITAAPPGFVRYMTEYPGQVGATMPMVLSGDKEQINDTNRHWNENITAIPDDEWQAMSPADMNHWQIVGEGFRGVCHDYAVTKRAALSVNAGALALAYCHRQSDAEKLNHLVLLANFSDGAYVLDNLFFDMYPLADCAYEMISRQVWGNPQQWESMGEA